MYVQRRLSGDGIVDGGRCSDLPEGIVWHRLAERGSAKGMEWMCCGMMLGADNRLEKSTPTCVAWAGVWCRELGRTFFAARVRFEAEGAEGQESWEGCG